MSTRYPELTPAEFGVMKALWHLDRANVADVRAELARRGSDLAYTTVMTLLGRLAGKGAVHVDKTREPFVYQPAHRRESVLRERLRDFVRDVFDGQAGSVVLHLVDDETISKDDLRAIERRIADAETVPAAEQSVPPATPKKSRKRT